jgi:hypothetical protein
MFRASIAHHQEIRCTYVVNGTSKMTVSEPGWSGSGVVVTPTHRLPLTPVNIPGTHFC